MPKIDLRTHQSEIFNDLIYDLMDAKTRFVVNYGGAGSGKSYTQQQLELINIMESDKDTLVIRKNASTLDESCYKVFKEIAEDWGITNEFKWVCSQQKKEITYKRTGRKIVLKGLDDPEKIKSIAGIRRVMVEEANQLFEKDFRELNRRVRGVKDIQITLLFNPVDEQHWLKRYFFDTPEVRKKTTIIKTTYLNNKFLTDEDRDEIEILKVINPNEYKIYALGEWGRYQVDYPYMNAFDERKHVSEEAKFKNGYTPVFSFDFNVDNCFAVLAQSGSDFIYYIDEIIGKDLYNVLDQIKLRYNPILPICMITGDRSGKNRHHALRDDINSYRIIMEELEINMKRIRILTNPPHNENRVLCNTILARYPEVKFHPRMTNTIYDMNYVEANKDGGIIKKDRSIANQKADGLDCVRYHMNAFHGDFIKKRGKR